jgi:hypothetical protein
VLVLVAMVSVALTAGASVGLVGRARPAALAEPDAATRIDVGVELFDDARTVALEVDLGAAQSVVVRAEGTLTESICLGGGALRSGHRVAAVDGVPVIGMSTRVPLWRDLAVGDTGDDVVAVKDELTRLGYPVSAGPRLDRRTARSIGVFLDERGRSTVRGESTLPLAALAWLPSAEVVASDCPVAVGSLVVDGDALADLRPSAVGVRAPIGGTTVVGARIVTVGSVSMTVDDSGAVTDPAELSALTSTEEFAAFTADPASVLSGRLTLAEPLPVIRVPSSALYDERDDGGACVVGDDHPVAVTVVASALGQTLVVPAADVDGVSITGEGAAACR